VINLEKAKASGLGG
jgi:hypothetical protein